MGNPVSFTRSMSLSARLVASASLFTALTVCDSHGIWTAAAHAQPAAAPAPGATAAAATKDSASCSVRIIHAQSEGGAIDKSLDPLRPQLTRPPLSAWKSFKLLEQKDLTLQHKAPGAVFAVPGDHQGTLEFLDKVEKEGKLRLRLRLQLQDGAAKLLSTTFVIDNGGTMLQAGTKHEKGMLVLGLTCHLNKP